jgi:UDP-glucose 6-dehydrogenase
VEVNAAQKARMVKKIREALGGSEAGKTIAVLGLTFKPETDDMCDAPSLAIIRAHDPHGEEEAKKLLPAKLKYLDDVYVMLTGADDCVLITEWNEYRGLDLEHILELMAGNVFVGLCNVYEACQMLSNALILPVWAEAVNHKYPQHLSIIIKIAHRHMFLHPGPGSGVSCIPKETSALLCIALEHDAPCHIVEVTVEVNVEQKACMLTKIRKALGGSEVSKTIAFLGLTFKPETDYMRDVPSLAVMPNLIDKGATIHATSPQGLREVNVLLPE